MKCEERRKEIVHLLKNSDNPVTAAILAEKFQVSRQIIVKDIANIRNNGTEILSMSKGYLLKSKTSFEKVFKTIHSDDEVEKELNLIVDLGGIVEDVFIYHKVYGIVRAPMDIKTRQDVQKFIHNIANGKSSLLKNVTAGYHYHTIKAENETALAEIEKTLKINKFLAPLKKHEPAKVSI